MKFFIACAIALSSIPALAANPSPDQVIQTLGTMLSESQNREAQARVEATMQKARADTESARAEKAEKELAEKLRSKPQ
jgi:hypothetical protein